MRYISNESVAYMAAQSKDWQAGRLTIMRRLAAKYRHKAAMPGDSETYATACEAIRILRRLKRTGTVRSLLH